jgi:hypothetical protein
VIRVKTFSPTRNGGLGEFETDADSQFELTYDMNGLNQFEEIGTLSGVASGNEASIDWTGRLPLTQYEWYVTVSDGEISSASPIWRFMTVGFEHRVYTSFLAK